ncbi:MAG: class I SAM-dependent methyltransferase [Myxococcaceae bacterium]
MSASKIHADDWAYAHQLADDRTAEASASAFEKATRFYRALLEKRLSKDRSARVLDLPCGSGGMVYALQKMGFVDVQGFERDARRVATAQALGLPCVAGDVFEVLSKQEAGSLGGVVCMDFLEHLEKSEAIGFSELVFNKLRPGGWLLVRTPCADAPSGASHIFNDLTHKWAATSGLLDWFLRAVGFSNVSVFGEQPNWHMSKGWLRVPLFALGRAFFSAWSLSVGLSTPPILSPSMWALARKAG